MDSIFDYEHPFVCTDAAIFTIKTIMPDNYRKLPEASLRILLYQRTFEPYVDKWCLPGGFLNIDEVPEDNICRKISEKTNVDNCWLEQLFTFCDLQRDPRARVISIAYLGLMNEAESANFESQSVWFTIKFNAEQQLVFINNEYLLGEQDFGFDHYNIIKSALERLQSKILYSNIIFKLLPAEFTLTQFQNVYETILRKKNQAANFRRKIMDMVQETDHFTSDKGHRPAKIYTAKKLKGDIIHSAEIMPDTIVYGPFKLTTASNIAYLNDKDIALQQKEYALLEQFIQSPGIALSAEYLYKKAWGRDMVGADSAVKTAISRLRRKLYGSGYTIMAERNEGYSFERE